MEKLKKIENAIILSVLTSGCFLIGWIYVSDYWGNFGISHLELNLDFNYYLTKAFPAIAILFFIFITYYQINESKSGKIHFYIYIYASILLFVSVLFAVNDITNKIIYSSILGVILISGGIIIFRYNRISDPLYLWYKIIFFAIVYVFLIVFVKELAKYRANNFRKSENQVMVSFEDYTAIPDSIKNKELILIFYNNDKYYVTDKQNKRLIIIPEQKDHIIYRKVKN